MAHMKEFGLDLGSNEYLGSFVWREFETGGEWTGRTLMLCAFYVEGVLCILGHLKISGLLCVWVVCRWNKKRECLDLGLGEWRECILHVGNVLSLIDIEKVQDIKGAIQYDEWVDASIKRIPFVRLILHIT